MCLLKSLKREDEKENNPIITSPTGDTKNELHFLQIHSLNCCYCVVFLHIFPTFDAFLLQLFRSALYWIFLFFSLFFLQFAINVGIAASVAVAVTALVGSFVVVVIVHVIVVIQFVILYCCCYLSFYVQLFYLGVDRCCCWCLNAKLVLFRFVISIFAAAVDDDDAFIVSCFSAAAAAASSAAANIFAIVFMFQNDLFCSLENRALRSESECAHLQIIYAIYLLVLQIWLGNIYNRLPTSFPTYDISLYQWLFFFSLVLIIS